MKKLITSLLLLGTVCSSIPAHASRKPVQINFWRMDNSNECVGTLQEISNTYRTRSAPTDFLIDEYVGADGVQSPYGTYNTNSVDVRMGNPDRFSSAQKKNIAEQIFNGCTGVSVREVTFSHIRGSGSYATYRTAPNGSSNYVFQPKCTERNGQIGLGYDAPGNWFEQSCF